MQLEMKKNAYDRLITDLPPCREISSRPDKTSSQQSNRTTHRRLNSNSFALNCKLSTAREVAGRKNETNCERQLRDSNPITDSWRKTRGSCGTPKNRSNSSNATKTLSIDSWTTSRLSSTLRRLSWRCSRSGSLRRVRTAALPKLINLAEIRATTAPPNSKLII